MVRKLKANHPERLCGENLMRVSKFSIGKAEENRKMKLDSSAFFLHYGEIFCTARGN